MIFRGGPKAGEAKSGAPLPVWLALASGGLLFLSFPGAAGFWPLAWVALVPLLLALRNARPGAAARLGLLAGMVHHVSLLYWIVIVLDRYGALPLWVSIPALLLLALYMSCYLVLFSVVIALVWQERETAVVWVAPLLWVGLDYARSFLFSGFPWQDLGYSQYSALLLIQTADLAGHFGISFHIVLVNAATALLLALWLEHRQRAANELNEQRLTERLRSAWFFALLPALCITAGILGYNLVRYQQVAQAIGASPHMKVGVVQGNIEQDQKWSPAMRLKTVEIYGSLSEEARAGQNGPPTLLVWPETALPFIIGNNLYFRTLQKDVLTKQHTWLLAGAPFYKKAPGKKTTEPGGFLSFNSAYLFSPEADIAGRYDKQHLVPFGEYVPLSRYLPLPGPLVENIGNFSAGEPVSPLSCQGAAIGVLICFESIFPALARDWTGRGANLLVNITNDAWFGDSSAPWQHLSMAVLRAVENRRSLARAANTGVSAFITPLGKIQGASPLFQPFYHVENVALLEEKTVFTVFGHHFGLLCFLGSIPALLLCRGRQRRQR
jgi:apolipoprotein N-acyltransferase